MDGLLLIDKPSDWTSHDVCQKLKRLLKEPRIGHTGTLDPMATGLMVVCVGEATKFVKYLTEHDKTYQATIRFGVATDSQDATGAILEEQVVTNIEPAVLDAAIATFCGERMQTPPAFSAIKIDGKKLYEYAHAGKTAPVAPSRAITIHAIHRTSELYKDAQGFWSVDIETTVSKGTYIRTLAVEIGAAIGCLACLSALRRTRIGSCRIEQAVTMPNVDSQTVSFLDPIVFLDLPMLVVDQPELLKKIANGAFLEAEIFPDRRDTVVKNSAGTALAVYTYDPQKSLMRVSVKLHERPEHYVAAID
ncbi:MAG: tRNA pseudouridine(55) synthase TruB [Bacillus subtilis]|nr:tRNA pseudouridine(55) synthase TruB [Bacillus subtilis]